MSDFKTPKYMSIEEHQSKIKELLGGFIKKLRDLQYTKNGFVKLVKDSDINNLIEEYKKLIK